VVTGSAALAASLLAVQALSAATAGAFEGPRGHHQFVQISTKGAPLWGARMKLLDNSGHAVYHWDHGYGDGDEFLSASGGKQTWWFTAGEGSSVEVDVSAADGGDVMGENNKEARVFRFGPGKPDGHCFHISPNGKLKYTGDSDTGGCTPD
jgi:hypothetical protein